MFCFFFFVFFSYDRSPVQELAGVLENFTAIKLKLNNKVEELHVLPSVCCSLTMLF